MPENKDEQVKFVVEDRRSNSAPVSVEAGQDAEPKIVRSAIDDIRDQVYSAGFASSLPVECGLDGKIPDGMAVSVHDGIPAVVLLMPDRVIHMHPQVAQQIGVGLQQAAEQLTPKNPGDEMVGIPHRLGGKILAGMTLGMALGIGQKRGMQIVNSVKTALDGHDIASALDRIDRLGKYTEPEWVFAIYVFSSVVVQNTTTMQIAAANAAANPSRSTPN